MILFRRVNTDICIKVLDALTKKLLFPFLTRPKLLSFKRYPETVSRNVRNACAALSGRPMAARPKSLLLSTLVGANQTQVHKKGEVYS
jgi:hypothetical protein